MTQNTTPDLSAGDTTPELSRASLFDAVKVVNKYGLNIEVPAFGVAGPINIKRSLNVSTTAVPLQGYGTAINVSQGSLRSTILQQSISPGNEERTFILNNLSPPAGGFTDTYVYDKTGIAASFYMQRNGAHTFAVAPGANKDDVAVTTSVAKIDSTGLTMLAGGISVNAGSISVTNTTAANVSLATLRNTANGSNLSFSSVNLTDAYIQGSFLGDSAIRAEVNNLVLGSLSGNTTIGTATKTLARWNANGTVVFTGTNIPTSTYGGFSVGSGVTIVVGAGTNVAADAKAFWIYKDNVPSFIGGGMQFNAQQGLDFWVGNTTSAWARTLQLQTSGKILIGGVQAATAIGDLHINQLGADLSGSLSLTGASTASYIVMGNRDSGGTAGPSIIAASNRAIQFGVGDSFVSRAGGAYTEYARIQSGSLGIGLTNPETYGPLAVNVTNGAAIGQVTVALKSGTSTAFNTACGGWGMYWGNNVFVGERVVSGGDANNAALAFYVGLSGASTEAGRFDTNGTFTVRGSSINLGTPSTNVLSCDASNQTYLRGSLVALQSTGAVNYLLANATNVTMVVDAIANGNLTVNGTIVSSRQIEKTTDKVVGSGVVVFDYSTTALWMTNGATANWTANFTNVPTAAGQATTVSIIHQQGATGYWPTAVQINGAAATIKWAGGMAPVPTPNNVDLFTFTLIRTTSNTWLVLGSATPYV